jgi:hypothetical protein
MVTVIDVLAFAVPAAVLAALLVIVVRAVGPFVDRSALFRAGPVDESPRGVQEGEPPRWDFTGASASAAPPSAPGSENAVAPPTTGAR